jgi:hypothetical protein
MCWYQALDILCQRASESGRIIELFRIIDNVFHLLLLVEKIAIGSTTTTASEELVMCGVWHL